jgi:hypothetical protein
MRPLPHNRKLTKECYAPAAGESNQFKIHRVSQPPFWQGIYILLADNPTDENPVCISRRLSRQA